MLTQILVFSILLAVGGYAGVKSVYSESDHFPDRSGMPIMPSTALETVVELNQPPGNIAVHDSGEVFFTFHPEASPDINVARLVEGKVEAFPSLIWQPGNDNIVIGDDEHEALHEVLSLRLHGNTLWLLDNGKHGLSAVRLLGFDINNGELVHSYRFPREHFALGSHANDFQISPDGRFFYISDASLIARTPALVVYDLQQQSSSRRLQGHASVVAGPYEPVVQGREMTLFGAFTVNPGVDGIALDQDGDWLYFASISADQLYRVRSEDLRNGQLNDQQLAAKVEALGAKTMTDGMQLDGLGNVYLSDLEHSAIVRRTPEGELQTLVKSADLRWPDGFSLQNGYLYVTCSSLHQVIGVSQAEMRAHGPFQIYRLALADVEQTLAGQ